jgi:hypothetical protein
MVGPIIQIHNRAPFAVIVTKGGRDTAIPPGRSHITADLLRYAKEQNPVHGTEDPNTLITESLISYVNPDPKRQTDPLDDLPIEVLQAMPKERLNRGLLAPDRQVTSEIHMPGFPRGRVGMEQPSPGILEPGAQGLGGGD